MTNLKIMIDYSYVTRFVLFKLHLEGLQNTESSFMVILTAVINPVSAAAVG